MTWTTDKPTQPGWYWWRKNLSTKRKIIEIVDEDGHFIAQGYELDWGIQSLGGYWSGPVRPPEEEA